MPIDHIEPGLAGPISICMELALPSGFLDNLFITPDGEIVIAEVKLWRNPQMRRQVVAQALDYAASLFNMSYEELEQAILKSDFRGKEKPNSLYEIVDGPDTLEEAQFIDAVNSNLRRGRMLVLVVGDGIRTELKTLVDSLQSHAGFHFTFALVELGVWKHSDSDEIVVPSTLAKTYGIERGIVRIDDQRTEVFESRAPAISGSPSDRETISSLQFFDAIKVRHPKLEGELKSFLRCLETIGVYPDYMKTLILRWDPPMGNRINLGYIRKTGQVWTDAVAGVYLDEKLALTYVRELAGALNLEISDSTGYPSLSDKGKAPRIEQFIGKFDLWYEAIRAFQGRLMADEDYTSQF